MIFTGFAYFISFLSKFSTKSIYLRFQIPSVPTILTLMVSVCDFQAKGFPFLFISVIAIPKKKIKILSNFVDETETNVASSRSVYIFSKLKIKHNLLDWLLQT